MTATHNLPEIHVQFRVPSGQFVQQCLCEDGFPGPGVAHDQSIAFNAHQHIDNGGIPHGVNGGDDDFVKRHRGRGLLRERHQRIASVSTFTCMKSQPHSLLFSQKSTPLQKK